MATFVLAAQLSFALVFPMVATGWTATEQSLTRALALQVPCLTLEQISRGWFASADEPRRAAESAAARLLTAGLLERRQWDAHPLLPLTAPLFRWRPGAVAPTRRRFESLAERASERWELHHVGVEVNVATRAARRALGAFGGNGHEKACEATHDLHLAEVFVQYRLRRPLLAAAWHGEAAFPKLGFDLRSMKDPDAFLLNEQGQAERIIEMTGRYTADHLADLHEHCGRRAAQRLSTIAASSPRSYLARLYPREGTGYELW